ncbi:hypothetical protein ACK2IE_20030 [Clostridioides difficile]
MKRLMILGSIKYFENIVMSAKEREYTQLFVIIELILLRKRFVMKQ